jgi:hypothetical protein
MVVREPSLVSGLDLPVLHRLHVDVVLAHVRHAVALGRELREHERGGLRVLAAELAQLPGAAIEHPVVAPGVLAPDARGVGVEEEGLAVVGELNARGLEGHRVARRHELRAGDDDRLRSRGRIHLDHVGGGLAFLPLESVEALPVRRPAQLGRALGGEEGRREDPLERQRRGIGLRRLLRGEWRGEQERQGDEQAAHRESRGKVTARKVRVSTHSRRRGFPGRDYCFTSSTRRLFCRPSGVVFGPAGLVSP